ncbi:aspartate aminotransferase family protein [Clostridium acetobutylicum]|uniref:(S)-3-amino-2-methylpropionate transaminase n=2 Tax=Clostridiaceae TaxID=31979 RepID=Q97M32_CLOAB|nr:4 animobutyrate aminotransferase [Clostridium acetobutylicum ATCC 824]AEI34610.1 4-aminobutyrate aminotransferase [Clostridium acetobutylicum DSM 1731]AWV80072.1 aspartate aminotransferase family protein [Clostridium acetobutylicum]PSM05875.1 aspartate aminotransferase family protein [Clostridium sp. NJ4]MBC2395894.1 aspartate aminotransferase family protein [Clostridium acetobutylicum]
MKMSSLYERSLKVIPPVAGRATKLGVVRGEGAYLYTEDGRKVLDFASGVAVCNLGHNNPAVIKAAKEQMDKLIHGGHNVVYYESYVKLAEKIVELTGNKTMVYFSNSGAEANEGAIKLAKYITKRQAIISFKGSFHGRTLATTSITGSSSKYRKNYEGLLPSVYFAEYPYCFRCPYKQNKESCNMECISQFEDMFKKLIEPESVAAIIMEPVQGEGGYIVPPKKFLKAVREICDKYGICLIFDEVQCGFGRTGKIFAHENFEVEPDIFTCAKAIASGFPLSAVIGKKELMEKWPAGAHGGTFGGNPVACAASLATIKELESGVLDNANNMGNYLKEELLKLKDKYACIGDIRGIGLMIGMEFCKENNNPDGDIVTFIREVAVNNNLILLGCGTEHNVLRFIAPLTVEKSEIDMAISIVEKGIVEYLNK